MRVKLVFDSTLKHWVVRKEVRLGDKLHVFEIVLVGFEAACQVFTDEIGVLMKESGK